MAYYPFAPEFGAKYTLVGPSGARAVFNDITDTDWVGALTEVTGLDSADVRENGQDLVEADGGAHGNFYYGRRPIVLNATIYGHASVAQRNLKIDKIVRASNAMRGDSFLSWKPATRVENFILNPGAEIDTSNTQNSGNWLATGATITRTTTGTQQGSGAYQIATAATASQGINLGTWAAGTWPPGTVLYASAYIKAPSGSTVSLHFGDSATGAASVNHSGTGFWTRVAVTYTVPANAGAFQFNIRNNNATAITFNVDNVMLSQSPTTTYIDGSTLGYYWQGTPHASASGDFIEMGTWVRRQQPLRIAGPWVKTAQIALVSQYAPLFSAAQSSVAGVGTAENRGSYNAYPIFRITGASVNPTITGSNGLVFRTTGLSSGASIAAGETIEVDTLNHSAVFIAGARNGQSANRYIDWATTQWPYIPAASTQTFTLAGGGSLVTLWRDAWA